MAVLDDIPPDLPDYPPYDDGGPGGRRGPRGGNGGGPGGHGGTGREGGSRTEFDRQPPQDVAAEQSVLGGMLLSKDAIADVVEVIRAEDFYRPAHATVFEAITELYGRGEPADPVTVSALLTKSGQLLRIGGAPYLHTLISSVPTAANAGYYAAIVAEHAVLRRLIEAGTRIVQMGYGAAAGDGSVAGEIDDVVDRAQAAMYDVTSTRSADDYMALETLVGLTLDEIEAIGANDEAALGIRTGLASLDEKLHPLQPGQMIVVAGRPGSGKSTLGLDIVRDCALRQHKGAVVFSLEMSKSELAMRLFSAETSIPLGVIRSGKLSDADWAKLVRRTGEMAEAPLFIDDSPNLTMMEIRAKARRLKQQHDIKLIVLDYLQLMTSGKRVESRQQEVSEFSRALKLLAKEVEVPVIALSQLNRGPETRTDKTPQLSDLRESGAIEQDCDVAILVHRPEMYADSEESATRVGEADLLVAKQRNGPTGKAVTIFQGQYSRFVDAASDL